MSQVLEYQREEDSEQNGTELKKKKKAQTQPP